MNVKKLIQQMKLRPGMYTGNLDLNSIYYFISGFLYNNIETNRADRIDLAFKNQFHEWVKIVLEKKQNIRFEEQRNCVFYINQTFSGAEERVKMFFELAEAFFKDVKENE